MSRVYDTGESSASIRARMDDTQWPDVLKALEEGATLYRPARMRDYYIRKGADIGGGCLSATRVKKLEEKGILQRVGVDTYGLVAQKNMEGAA
jgi:hypothetical protein